VKPTQPSPYEPRVAPSFRKIDAQIRAAARTDAKVLILGETGVGKEIVARLIHGYSARRAERFIAVNCSGIPETLLESELFGHVRGSFTGAYRDKPGIARTADRGTLFLDELGEMSLRMQAVLLRLAETGEIHPIGSDGECQRTNARIVAATNRDLKAQVAAGEFREDFYYRLNVIQIEVPPLRARREDIPFLLEHFLSDASLTHQLPIPQLTPTAQEALQDYSWRGNVRELKNFAERLVVQGLGRPVDVCDLPGEIVSGGIPVSPLAGVAPEPARIVAGPTKIDELWQQLERGGTFWSVVHEPFRSHDLTRADVRRLVERGLHEARGSYRALLPLLNLPATDYKRLLSFLHQHDCHVAFQPFRNAEAKTEVRVAG
jgi:DNA-binding NtrC family response regulator